MRRIKWVAEHEYNWAADSCESAHRKVLENCDVCFSCTLQEVYHCQPFSCSQQAAAGGAWSDKQIAWCCKFESIGCVEGADVSTDVFDQGSDASTDLFDQGSDESTDFFHQGAADLMPQAGLLDKFLYHKDPPVDCDQDYDTWQTTWLLSKQVYCCNSVQRGCEPDEQYGATVASGNDFDCSDEWYINQWPAEKRAKCCQESGIGCEDLKQFTLTL